MSLVVDDLTVYYRSLRGDVKARRRRQLRDRRRRDHGPRGRVGLRQVDARQEPDPHGRAHEVRRRPRRARRQGAADLGRREDERASASRRSRSSRSTRMSALNPTRRIGAMAADLLASRDVALDEVLPELQAPARARRAPGRRARPLPDRALRRDEAARRDGALVAARPVAADRRRGHLGARRLDAARGGRAARRVPRPRLRQEHDRDHPRPVRPLPDRRHDPRHVRGQARREGAGRDDHRRAAASRTRGCCSRRCPRSACASPSSG